jgi:hypothetical protein
MILPETYMKQQAGRLAGGRDRSQTLERLTNLNLRCTNVALAGSGAFTSGSEGEARRPGALIEGCPKVWRLTRKARLRC